MPVLRKNILAFLASWRLGVHLPPFCIQTDEWRYLNAYEKSPQGAQTTRRKTASTLVPLRPLRIRGEKIAARSRAASRDQRYVFAPSLLRVEPSSADTSIHRNLGFDLILLLFGLGAVRLRVAIAVDAHLLEQARRQFGRGL